MNTLSEVNLKVEWAEAAPCQKDLKVEVPQEVVEAEFQAVYRELRKVARVPGFRVGNAPQDLLEKHHSRKAREEVLHRLLSRSMEEALASQPTFDVVGRPEVKDYTLEPKTSFRYTARLEVAPQVLLGPYKGLKLSRAKIQVTDEMIGQILTQLQNSNAELKPLLEPRAAAAGDFLVVDLMEQRAGKRGQKQKEVVLPLDLDHDPEGILKGLLGMQPGQKRTLTLKDGGIVLVELKALKVKEVLPLDDRFARTAGPYDSLKALKEAVGKDLERRAQAAQQQTLEAQALQKLVEEWKFEVPPSLIASQTRRNLKGRAVELLQQGIPPTQVQEHAQALTDQAKQDALRQVKLFFILRRVAAEEKFSVSEEELESRLQTLAARLQKSVEEVRKDLEARDLLEELVWGIVRAKVLELILREANIEES